MYDFCLAVVSNCNGIKILCTGRCKNLSRVTSHYDQICLIHDQLWVLAFLLLWKDLDKQVQRISISMKEKFVLLSRIMSTYSNHQHLFMDLKEGVCDCLGSRSAYHNLKAHLNAYVYQS